MPRALLDERDEDAQDRRAQQDGAERVESLGPALGRGRRRQIAAGEQQDHRADREVDEEHRPPAVVGPEQSDQRAPGERADRGRHGDGGAEEAERLTALLAPEQALDEARDLRADETAGEPLDDPQQHERERRRRQRAGRACDHEQRHADHEHRSPSVRVAEAPRRHEQQSQRERVARDDPLQLVGLRMQALLDARQGDVDDRDVEQRHEPGREDDPEGHPAVRVGAILVVRWRRRASRRCGGHGPWLVDGAHAVPTSREGTRRGMHVIRWPRTSSGVSRRSSSRAVAAATRATARPSRR